MKTNLDLVSSFAGRIAEMAELCTENNELRKLVNNTAKAPHQNDKHLIVADISVEYASAKSQDVEIIQRQDMTYTEETIEALTSQAKNSYGKVILVIGANACQWDTSHVLLFRI